MSKLKLSAILGAASILLSATGPSMAGGLALGVQGSAVYIETSGTETLKTSGTQTKASESAAGAIPGAFIQYTFGDNGFVVGLEKIPGRASLGRQERTTTDALEGNDPNNTSDAPSGTQTAKANVQDHISAYVETPGWGPTGLHVKLGYSKATIETEESLYTGAAYGNEDINGYTVGVGFKNANDNGMLMKVTAEYTDYDNVTFNSTGSDVSTKIVADPEIYALKLSIGYQF